MTFGRCNRCGEYIVENYENSGAIHRMTLGDRSKTDVTQWLCVNCYDAMVRMFSDWGATKREGEVAAVLESVEEFGQKAVPATKVLVDAGYLELHHPVGSNRAYLRFTVKGFEASRDLIPEEGMVRDTMPVGRVLCPGCKHYGENGRDVDIDFTKRDGNLKCKACGFEWRPEFKDDKELPPSIQGILKTIKDGDDANVSISWDGRRFWVEGECAGRIEKSPASDVGVMEAIRSVLSRWVSTGTSPPKGRERMTRLTVVESEGKARCYVIPKGMKHVRMGSDGPLGRSETYNHELGDYVKLLKEVEGGED